MKKTILWMLALVMIAMASCSKDSDSEILKTVPQNAGMVYLVNLPAINEKLKADGEAPISELLEATFGHQMEKEMKFFLGEDSPVDLDASMVFFFIDRNPVFSLYVKDEKGFRSALEDQMGITLKETNGVWSAPNGVIYQIGNQVWFTGGYSDITDVEIKKFSTLDKEKSILNLDAAKNLADKGSDVCMILNVNRLSSIDRDFANSAMALNMAFDDPNYITAFVNFDKGEVNGELTVLDSKGKPSALAFKPAKINVSKLKNYTGQGNVFVAMGIDPKVMSALLSKLQGFGLPSEVTSILGTLDGNIVISFDATTLQNSYGDPSMDMLFTFDSADNASRFAGQMASQAGSNVTYNIQGNEVLFSTGQIASFHIGNLASRFDGATLGIVANFENMGGLSSVAVSNFIKNASLMCHNDGEGIKIELKAETLKDKNSLATLIRLAGIATQQAYYDF